MPKFRKKPVVIDAIRYYPAITVEELYGFAGIQENAETPFRFADGRIYIWTREGEMAADQGDWIIKGIKGEFYPCKPDVFSLTYEPAATKEGEDGY